MRAGGQTWRCGRGRRGWRSRVWALLVAAAAVFPVYRLYFSRSDERCDVGESIDAVYTWVNGSDPLLLESMREFARLETLSEKEDLLQSRFDDKLELKYSLRSLQLYAPWIRRIYIVTADQLPSWLDVGNDGRSRLTLISHSDIMPPEFLPTFSSPAIECFLHKIPGLSERFLYFNDDIFLGAPAYLSDFYTPGDGYQVYTAWTVPDCARGCPWSFLGDGSCDRPCDNPLCDFDGGDCAGKPKGETGHPDYPGDYEESQFFNDDDEKLDYGNDLNRIGYDESQPGAKDLHARQIEDSQLLQRLLKVKERLESENERSIGANITMRKIKSLPLKNNLRKTRQVQESDRTKPSNSSLIQIVDENISSNDSKISLPNLHIKLTNINMPVFSREPVQKTNVLKEILKVSNVTNVTNIISQFNKSVIKNNKLLRKKRDNDTDSLDSSKAYKDFRKLDTYAKSLIYTNKIFNKLYGFQNRKVPAHVPFLMEKKIIDEMHAKFRNEIEITKRNKFRRPNDFQFAFGYYHYLISEKEEYTIEEIFDKYDTDKSGTWSDREVRTVLARIHGPPLTAAVVRALEITAKGCDSEEHRLHPTPPNERYMDSDMPTLTKKLIVDCPELRGPLRGALGYRKPRAFPRSAASQSTFAMLSSNITKAVIILDEIRRDTKKFICINDNMNANQEAENEIIRMVLQELYDSLLPLPSQWELPSHVANKFLRISDLIMWQETRKKASRTLIACAILLFILTLYQISCCSMFKKKIKTCFC